MQTVSEKKLLIEVDLVDEAAGMSSRELIDDVVVVVAGDSWFVPWCKRVRLVGIVSDNKMRSKRHLRL